MMVVLVAALAVGCGGGGDHQGARRSASRQVRPAKGRRPQRRLQARPRLSSPVRSQVCSTSTRTAPRKSQPAARPITRPASSSAPTAMSCPATPTRPSPGRLSCPVPSSGSRRRPDDPRDKPITDGASVSPIHLQGADGKEVVVYTLSSDTVFGRGIRRVAGPRCSTRSAISPRASNPAIPALNPPGAGSHRLHQQRGGKSVAVRTPCRRRGCLLSSRRASTGRRSHLWGSDRACPTTTRTLRSVAIRTAGSSWSSARPDVDRRGGFLPSRRREDGTRRLAIGAARGTRP